MLTFSGASPIHWPDGHAPGNQLGDARGILGACSLGIVLTQNDASDIAEATRPTEREPGTLIPGGGDRPTIEPEVGRVGDQEAVERVILRKDGRRVTAERQIGVPQSEDPEGVLGVVSPG